ncbi:MAG: terminase [Candidatus Acidiferrales bacterium]
MRIRERPGPLVRFRPNEAQKRYARQRTRRNIILKARQLGMTTYIAARFFLLTMFREGTTTLQVAHSEESAQRIFRIVRRFYDTLQADLRAQIHTGPANVRELAFTQIDSRYLVDTAGNRNVGRGLTIHNLHASEVALWPGDPRETMAALLAAVVPGGLVDVESTPNGVGGYFHSEWLRAKSGEPDALTPHFFPWWMEPAYCINLPGASLEPYSDDEQQLVERHRLSAGQIRYRRWLRATFGGLAPQEYAETDDDCFLLSGCPVFETAVIEKRLRELQPPPSSEHNGALLLWCEPQPGRDYIIGADVAEGRSDGDYSAAVVIDVVSGLQCAELMARWPIWQFARELSALGRRYNAALLAVERNNHGHAVLHALRHQHTYPRIYRYADSAAGFGAAADGWPMNAQTKPHAIQTLGDMLRDAPRTFASARLLEQCRRFAWLDGGSTGVPGAGNHSRSSEGDAAAHDDLVIATAIALAVRAQARPVTLLTCEL